MPLRWQAVFVSLKDGQKIKDAIKARTNRALGPPTSHVTVSTDQVGTAGTAMHPF